MSDDFRRVGETDTVKSALFTPAEKMRCIAREIAMRRRVYPGRVNRGQMKQAEADREIAIMEAILADMRLAARPDLSEVF